jgi:hypothetical protein
VACPLNCKCEAACHTVPLFCNVPREQKDALGYADSARDEHCANHASPLFHELLSPQLLRKYFYKFWNLASFVLA